MSDTPIGNIEMKASDFIRLLKDSGMVVGPKTVFDRMMVKGIPLHQYRNRILRKKMLSAREITDAQLWGALEYGSVKKIMKSEVPESEMIKCHYGATKTKYKYKIPRSTVVAIANERGVEIEV